jgi:hypothetical protein
LLFDEVECVLMALLGVIFMPVRFAGVDERFIDAVRRLREQNAVNSPFYQAVMEGIRDIESGRTRPLTPALMRSLRKKGYQDADEV